MLKRIFLAINLPDSTKKELLSYKEKWPELPARWTLPENLHITLLFLGNMSEKDLQELLLFSQGVTKKHNPFEIELSGIEYGPSSSNPRMIWITVQESKELHSLQKDIQQFRPNENSFSPHLTLARLRQMEFRRIDPEERPEIHEEFSIHFSVNSFEIMESNLRRQSPEYTVLKRFALQS